MSWDFPASIQEALNRRTAVYGPVRTVVWQGGAREGSPYADGFDPVSNLTVFGWKPAPELDAVSLREVGRYGWI